MKLSFPNLGKRRTTLMKQFPGINNQLPKRSEL